ncbi:DUF6152 family protein [Aurantiacibacter rhizosphaerae]|uniref:DUF3592 domain-containing protein n=1 Tax=Aurantiacibacter rhizosphaerae TaxID=2691582 RepID=A0A844XD78_9SPHN|nr:DUF6152 family protein [Aurantiacibacter rhizosphaerae]MWV27558.1 hypothetical protein [Aurantiacibacter rhizosphaerae]
MMKLSKAWMPAFALAIGAVAAPAVAHHSFAMFDRSEEKTITGVVGKFAWTNPHVMIDMSVKDKQGNSARYRIESASVNILMREGWRVGAIKSGDRITVVYNPLKDGRRGGLLVKVRLADGTVLNG